MSLMAVPDDIFFCHEKENTRFWSQKILKMMARPWYLSKHSALDLLALADGRRGHWHLQGPQTAGNTAKS